MNLFSYLFPPCGVSHPLDDNLPSATSGQWTPSKVCPFCKNDISHRERHAGICETCGRSFEWVAWQSAATREVLRSGRWVKQRRINGVNFLYRGNKSWGRAA